MTAFGRNHWFVQPTPNFRSWRIEAPRRCPARAGKPCSWNNPHRQDEPPVSQAAAVSNFTRFNTVPFGAGEVQSAWEYQSSAQQSPSRQYCQYLEPTNTGTYAVTIIGWNGRIDLPASRPAGVDLSAAAALCQWKADSAKPAPAPSTTNLIHAKS